MKRLLPAALLLAGAFASGAADPAIESVVRSREARITQAKNQYEAAVRQIDREAVDRLTQLLNARTRSGDVSGALAVRHVIQSIQGSAPDAGAPPPAARFADADRMEKEVEQRYLDLHRALIANDLDEAVKFVDPKNMEFVKPAAAKALLGALALLLKAGDVGEHGVRVQRVEIGIKGTEARVEARYQIQGRWQDQKPSYWVRRDGVWYLGDERELAGFR